VPFLRPTRMVKVGLVGLKDDRDAILSVLHDLGVVQVETIQKEALQYLEPERGSDIQRTVGDQVVRFRGLKAALPATGDGAPRAFRDLAELLEVARSVPIDDEVGALKREEDRLITDRKARQDEIALLRRHAYYADRLEYLHGPSILSFFGEASPEAFEGLRPELPRDVHLVARPGQDPVLFLAVVPTAEADGVARAAQVRQVTLTTVPRRTGTPSEVLPQLESEQHQIEGRLAEIAARLGEISRAWYSTVLALEEGFAIENRKLELYTRFGAADRTFALEGWVPELERPRLEAAVEAATGGRAVLYPVATTETPPTKMENPRGIRWYEFFIRFYSLPQADEWDPTWVFAVVFPIFFGLMLGDWGYGLVILSICLWMIAGFPGRTKLPGGLRRFLTRIMSPTSMRSLAYTLVPGCLVGIAAGVVFNSFFGFQVLPTPYIDPVSKVGVSQLLLLAGYIGLGMVTFGFALGALKEYFHHHIRGAFGKIGGIAFAWGITIIGLGMIRGQLDPSTHPVVVLGIALLIAGALLLIGGEGIQMGGMGVIEVVSHVLSYTRLVGILLASAVLALVAKIVGTGLAGGGSLGGLIAGALIIFVVAGFNIVLGVFEPGIQGARLIFVENFSKYYTGNGKPFRPLGTRRKHTVAPSAAPAVAASPP